MEKYTLYIPNQYQDVCVVDTTTDCDAPTHDEVNCDSGKNGAGLPTHRKVNAKISDTKPKSKNKGSSAPSKQGQNGANTNKKPKKDNLSPGNSNGRGGRKTNGREGKGEPKPTKSPVTLNFNNELTPQGVFEIVNNFDRPPSASTGSMVKKCESYSYGMKNEPGKRIPKKGGFAKIAAAEATAQTSIFEADARVFFGGASYEITPVEISANATIGVGSASVSAGPVSLKVGLCADTGFSFSYSHVSAKFLGFEFSIGSKLGISLFGTGISFKLF